MADRLSRDTALKIVQVIHDVGTAAWLICLPVAILTGWVYSLVFISAASIYANFVSHFVGAIAARTDREVNNGD